MTEVEAKVLESYKTALGEIEDFEPEQIQALAHELSSDMPNPERLAEIIKLKKKPSRND